MKVEAIENLTRKLNTLPGISKKTAEKITFFLLSQPREYAEDLAKEIEQLKTKISYCPKCNYFVENNLCINCTRSKKERFLVVVENVQSLRKIEELDEFYNGYFFILPYLMNLKDQLSKKDYEYEQLLKYVAEKHIEEVIIVLSPTLEGEMTTTHLLKLLKKQKVNATRAAIGMPMGSNVEYLDSFTLRESIKNRKED